VKAISRAHDWVDSILAGKYKDQRAVAASTGLNERYVSRVISCAFLAPDIVESIVDGEQPDYLTFLRLTSGVPAIWSQQTFVSSEMSD
jgi:hypothetical protein